MATILDSLKSWFSATAPPPPEPDHVLLLSIPWISAISVTLAALIVYSFVVNPEHSSRTIPYFFAISIPAAGLTSRYNPEFYLEFTYTAFVLLSATATLAYFGLALYLLMDPIFGPNTLDESESTNFDKNHNPFAPDDMPLRYITTEAL